MQIPIWMVLEILNQICPVANLSTDMSDNTDCDDNDINIGTTLYDADCDGLLSINDCDDNDNSTEHPYATGEGCAGVSCEEIRDTNRQWINPTDGVYWINPEGTTMQVYCDKQQMKEDGPFFNMIKQVE